MLCAMESSLFHDVGDALRGILPSELGTLQIRAHRYGIKVWFGTDTATKEHYEAQVVGAKDVPGARTLALEVGFHSEHPKAAANDAVRRMATRANVRLRMDGLDKA